MNLQYKIQICKQENPTIYDFILRQEMTISKQKETIEKHEERIALQKSIIEKNIVDMHNFVDNTSDKIAKLQEELKIAKEFNIIKQRIGE